MNFQVETTHHSQPAAPWGLGNLFSPKRKTDSVFSVAAARKSVLLVEDDEADALLAIEVLREVNDTVNVVHVRDAMDAMSYLRGGGVTDTTFAVPDLIILDLNMPRMNGYDFFEQILESELRDSRLIVWSTTAKVAANLPICVEMGIECIDKPMTLSAFKDRLKAACEPILRQAT